jgi:hypothetical protein
VQDVYAFDRFISGPLDSTLVSPQKDMTTVYFFVRDPYHMPIRKRDWVALGLSAVKGIEVYFLWRLGARTLCWVAAAPWFHFFFAAIILQTFKISCGYTPEDRSEADILAGELPTAKIPGGDRKILLRMPTNFRYKLPWRLTWLIGILICIPSLLGTYILLGRQKPVAVYSWLGFQLLWLTLRLILYHLIDGADHLVFPGLSGQEWQALPLEMKERATALLMALARYQTHEHPRGSYSYEEDLLSFEKIADLLPVVRSSFRESLPMKESDESLSISFHGILGDTVLSSAAWLSGSELNGMDLYDATLAIVEVSGNKLAVPAVRVLSGNTLTAIISSPKADPERAVPRFRSNKGLPNPGTGITWLYWIPCDDGRWLHVVTENMKVMGARKAQIMSDADVSARLGMPDLNVSLSTVDDVKDTLGFSRRGANILLALIQ